MSSRCFIKSIRCVVVGCFILFSLHHLQASTSIDVILWFDTEDFLLPADDDATKRLCEMLTQRGIRATFKLVGEKARVLEKRGRQDVIAALKKHDIGYHSDFHSVHPTPTEYLADCGWLDGVSEFERREKSGAADVKRILGVTTLSCYGQPGSSWAPQAIAALRQIGVSPRGVPCYVDEGNQVGLNAQPFWYAGALNVFHMGSNYTRMELHDPAAVEPAKKKVSEIVERLRTSGGGIISIFYHPCEWVHQEFWDGANFAHGANPPRERWKPPGQISVSETDSAFQRFAQYIDHIRSISNIHWVTASDLPVLYPDRTKTEGTTAGELTKLSDLIIAQEGRLDYLQISNRVYSVADQFELLTLNLHESFSGRKENSPLKPSGLLGPDSAPPKAEILTNITALAFRDALQDVFQFIQTQHRIPARVFIGPDAVSPADFLVAMASVWKFYQQPNQLPEDKVITLGQKARIMPENHIATDTPGLFGGWVIHKVGFRAPKVMEQARLQAWTLKPALHQ
ncbi:MAG: hypothetical protein JWN25_1181 [Verrucomicrobiales bacterium]|nr:hypothetical protein [Verrucomicrobiales bacterium]